MTELGGTKTAEKYPPSCRAHIFFGVARSLHSQNLSNMKFLAFVFAFVVCIVAVAATQQQQQPKLENYHAEPAEEDREAAYYRNSDDQFRDLHERMQALVCGRG
jgi:hypothetical protein